MWYPNKTAKKQRRKTKMKKTAEMGRPMAEIRAGKSVHHLAMSEV